MSTLYDHGVVLDANWIQVPRVYLGFDQHVWTATVTRIRLIGYNQSLYEKTLCLGNCPTCLSGGVIGRACRFCDLQSRYTRIMVGHSTRPLHAIELAYDAKKPCDIPLYQEEYETPDIIDAPYVMSRYEHHVKVHRTSNYSDLDGVPPSDRQVEAWLTQSKVVGGTSTFPYYTFRITEEPPYYVKRTTLEELERNISVGTQRLLGANVEQPIDVPQDLPEGWTLKYPPDWRPSYATTAVSAHGSYSVNGLTTGVIGCINYHKLWKYDVSRSLINLVVQIKWSGMGASNSDAAVAHTLRKFERDGIRDEWDLGAHIEDESDAIDYGFDYTQANAFYDAISPHL